MLGAMRRRGEYRGVILGGRLTDDLDAFDAVLEHVRAAAVFGADDDVEVADPTDRLVDGRLVARFVSVATMQSYPSTALMENDSSFTRSTSGSEPPPPERCDRSTSAHISA